MISAIIGGGGSAGYTGSRKKGLANGLKLFCLKRKAVGGVLSQSEGYYAYQNSALFRQVVVEGTSSIGISVPDSYWTSKKIIDRKDKIVKKLTGGVKMTVSSYGAVIVPQEAVIVGEADGRFRLSAAGEAYLK